MPSEMHLNGRYVKYGWCPHGSMVQALSVPLAPGMEDRSPCMEFTNRQLISRLATQLQLLPTLPEISIFSSCCLPNIRCHVLYS